MGDEKLTRLYLFIIFILSLSIFLFLWLSPSEDEYSYTEEDIPKVDVRAAKIYGFDNGKLKLSIDANIIEIPEEEDIAIFKGIKEGIVYRNKEPEFKIKAREIRINTNTKDAYFLGHVVISKSDTVLKGNYFFWSAKYEKLTGRKGVEIMTDDVYIKGRNLSSDVNMKDVNVSGGVIVNIYLGG